MKYDPIMCMMVDDSVKSNDELSLAQKKQVVTELKGFLKKSYNFSDESEYARAYEDIRQMFTTGSRKSISGLFENAVKKTGAKDSKTIDKAIKACDEKRSVENNPPYTLEIIRFEFSVYEKAKRGETPKKIDGGKETIGKTIKLNGKTLNEALKESYDIVGKIYTQKTKDVISKYKNKTVNGGVALCHIIAKVSDADGNWAKGSRGIFEYSTQEKWNN